MKWKNEKERKINLKILKIDVGFVKLIHRGEKKVSGIFDLSLFRLISNKKDNTVTQSLPSNNNNKKTAPNNPENYIAKNKLKTTKK